MRNIVIGIFTMVLLSSCFSPEREWKVVSPDGNIRMVVFSEKPEGEKESRLTYKVIYKEKEVVETSPLGIIREDEQFSRNLKFVSKTDLSLIDEKYTLKSGKRLTCHNFAYQQVLTFENENGKQVELIIRTYNDGVALRYRFPGNDTHTYKVISEETGFQLSPEGTAWIHPYHWNTRKKPSYEDYCESEIAIGTLSPKEQGWAYPMLFHTKNSWVMITEAVMDGTYCATHIRNTPDGLYTVCFAEKEEVVIPDDPEPTSTLPWATPWRVIAISSDLAGIVETNIVQNLNPSSVIADESWIRPGRSSWSWWSDGSSSKSYQAQIRYVDFTAEMGWEYTLIDAGWPDMKGGSVEDVVEYANRKNVGIWLWYHSGAGYPQEEVNYFNIMSIPQARKKELARIHKLGVKGIKVDFFDTDKQEIIKLYKEILQDAAEYQIMVNFHGASLPRGLERTYPNLMTTEAIRGAEAFGQQPACDRAPVHNVTVPFTRNLVGSMDYTPVTFSNKIRQGVEAFNITTYAHQLALSVVFESGVQNFADKLESYQALPKGPKEFLKEVPAAWDETRLISGYLGDHVIMARRKGDTWYIGGINGKNEKRLLTFELPFIEAHKEIDFITDGKDRIYFNEESQITGTSFTVNVLPYGGFVAKIKL